MSEEEKQPLTGDPTSFLIKRGGPCNEGQPHAHFCGHPNALQRDADRREEERLNNLRVRHRLVEAISLLQKYVDYETIPATEFVDKYGPDDPELVEEISGFLSGMEVAKQFESEKGSPDTKSDLENLQGLIDRKKQDLDDTPSGCDSRTGLEEEISILESTLKVVEETS